jgi:glycosyltransferase involved in cell wall biosynthesis
MTADADEIVAVSAANLDMLRAHFGLPSDAGRVICNGRPSSFFAPQNPIARQQVRSELAIPADSIVCITVARLEYSKGYQYQLDALVRLNKSDLWPNLHLIWVGEGTMFDRIQQYVRLLGCSEQVHLVGARNDVPDLLDAADIFVLPSQFEGMPLVVLEAMAKRLPVIATAFSGTPEALGGTGWLLADPAEEPIADQLVESIVRLARDPGLRHSYAERAAFRAQESFTLERMERDYLDMFERVLSPSLVSQR